MKSHACSRLAVSVAVILVGFTTSALAGPPLICHPFDIGQAKSLPWIDWNQQGSGGYDLRHLTGDTLAILASNRNVLVQMETLRRAGIYARQYPQVARELLTRLHARAASTDAAGHSDALAWFDVGYLAETYKQWIGKGEPNPASGLDGYGWVKKAISLRGQDPEMEFSAALITLTGSKDDYQEHARKALEGAKTDPLLAQNVATHLDRRTVSEVFTDKSAGRI